MKDTEILRTIHRWMNQSIQRDEDEHRGHLYVVWEVCHEKISYYVS